MRNFGFAVKSRGKNLKKKLNQVFEFHQRFLNGHKKNKKKQKNKPPQIGLFGDADY